MLFSFFLFDSPGFLKIDQLWRWPKDATTPTYFSAFKSKNQHLKQKKIKVFEP